VRLGFVGLGDIGARHLTIAQGLSRAIVVAVCDLDESRLRWAANAFGVSGFRDYRRLLEDAEIDAIFVLTPPGSHRQIVEDALSIGKHVFCEKPLAQSLQDAAAIVAAVGASDLVGMVAFQERFNPAFRQMHELVRKGDLGSLEFISISGRVSRKKPVRPWMFDRLQGGGVLLESAVHSFDLVRWVSGLEFDRVFAETVIKGDETKYEETVAAVGRLEGGIVVQVDATFALPEGVSFESRVDVIGQNGRLNYNLDRQPLWLDSETGIYVNCRTATGQTYIDQLHYSDSFGAYYAEQRHFVDCILDDVPCEAPASEGFHSLAVAIAAAQSASLGKPVTPRRSVL
jgi:predicted dehydrogenase